MNYRDRDLRYPSVSPSSMPSSIALVSATGKPFFWKAIQKEPGNSIENLSVRGKPDLTRKEEQTLSPVKKPKPAGVSLTSVEETTEEVTNYSLGSTERSEISKVAESEGGHSKHFPQHYLIEDHLKTPDAVKQKKFAFGWTQSMKKTPFGSPFLKVHGMYSRGISSLGQVSRTNTDNGKSDKESIEMSGKVTFTPTRPNIVERNVCLNSPAVQSSSADQLMSQGERSCVPQFTPTDRLSTQVGEHPLRTQRGKGHNMFPIAQSTPTDPLITPGGRYHLINRWRRNRSPSIHHIHHRRSRSPDLYCGRRNRSPSVHHRSRSPDLYRGRRNRSLSIHHRSRSPGLDCGRRSRSPIIHHIHHRSPGLSRRRRNRSPSFHHTRRRSPGLHCGRSRSPAPKHGRRSMSPAPKHGRSSESSSTYHARNRSPVIQCERSKRPVLVHGGSRSLPLQYATYGLRRSGSPSFGCGKVSISPRKLKSPSFGRGKVSISPRRLRSPSFDSGKVSISPRRLRSPSINIGTGDRICHSWTRSPSPSIDLWRSRSSSIHSLRLERRGKSQRTDNGSINRSGKLGGRQSRSPSINLKRSSKKSRSNYSSINRITRSRSSSSETLRIRRKSLDRSSSESWTEVQIGRNKNLRNKGFWDNENEREKQNFSLVALYSSEEEALNPQKLVNSENGYWEKIKRLKTDQDRLWLAKTEFENPVCSDPVTNLTFHGYKRKKAHMMEKDDDDSFYEFFTNPDIVRLKEVKYEKRQKFYIKEGRVLPMPGYIQKTDLRCGKKSVFSEDVPREILDAERFKALIEKGFYQKFQNKSQTASCRSQKRDKKSLIAHFKNGQDEAMQFLKFYNSEFDRSHVEEAVYLEKMYKIFSCHYGKTQRLYCKTCAFPHSF